MTGVHVHLIVRASLELEEVLLVSRVEAAEPVIESAIAALDAFEDVHGSETIDELNEGVDRLHLFVRVDAVLAEAADVEDLDELRDPVEEAVARVLARQPAVFEVIGCRLLDTIGVPA